MRLADVIGLWLGKVEIVLAGADDDLRAGQDALATGDAMAARAAAHRVLARAPDSPLGLALLADACEMAGLDAELALTLEELSQRAASRAEVWVRLGRARRATNEPLDDVRDAFVRALAVAESGSEARRDALLELADLDLAQGDGARAELWLERAALEKSAEVSVRRAEARLQQGDAAGARVWLGAVEISPADGRAALALGRALAVDGDPGAFAPLLRAMVLDVAGASELLSSTLAWVASDDATRTRVRAVVEAKGESALARWRAAFARAQGDPEAARSALTDAVRAGDTSAAAPLLDAALDDHDHAALDLALSALPPSATSTPTVIDAQRIPRLDAVSDPEKAIAVLDSVASVTSARVVPWANDTVHAIARAWAPSSGGAAAWPALLARLDQHARALADLEAIAELAALSAERGRPVRVAIVGEFNAGKSTFINALIGADVAPTGVLPTTATLHHLRYAPDPIARILFVPAHDPHERIVSVGDLRRTLQSVDATAVRRVEILLPIASLTRVEILDTPGFNAPDQRHTDAARDAFAEADAAIWLLDAGQAMKRTERAILEEAKAANVPVQLLVNKADRLAPADLAKVMALVEESLREVGLASWTPPIAMSARKALAGKLGDAAALEASGWSAVEALLDQQILGRSDELKERALRRRAARIVARLLGRAGQIADDERASRKGAADRAQRIAQLAAKLDRDADGAADGLARSLGPSAVAWRRDLAVVVTGRDPDAVARDRVLSRYRVARALDRIASPLAHAMAALAEGSGITPSALAPLARALVRAAAATSEDFDEAVPPLARAAVATLVEHLFVLAVSPPAASRADGQLRELGAFAEALTAKAAYS